MKSIEFKSLLIGILGTTLVMMLMGKSVFQPEPYQIQCVHLEDTIGMGYVACRLFDMNNISKRIKSSKPDFLYTEREFWEFYPERDLN